MLNTKWRQIQPNVENCGFTPQDEDIEGITRRLDSAYVKFGAGIKTNRDAVAIGFEDASLLELIREFDGRIASHKHARDNIYSLLYRPFDIRRIFYHKDVIASRSLPTMKHVLAGQNIGFICSSTWTTPTRFSVSISRLMVEMKTGTHDRGTSFFPLYRYEGLLNGDAEKIHNLTPEFVKQWCASTQTRFIPTGQGDGENTTGPEDTLFWLYGLFYSPEYRRRFRASLSQGFPIIVLPSNLKLFRALSQIGCKLISLHLMEAPSVKNPITKFIGPDDLIGANDPTVEKVSYSVETVWLNKNQTIGFKGVPEKVWNFHIGGYQVCHKWLKDRQAKGGKNPRPGRVLNKEDRDHYQGIIVVISETIRLMDEIDQVIDQHGGWPGAFQAKDSNE